MTQESHYIDLYFSRLKTKIEDSQVSVTKALNCYDLLMHIRNILASILTYKNKEEYAEILIQINKLENMFKDVASKHNDSTKILLSAIDFIQSYIDNHLPKSPSRRSAQSARLPKSPSTPQIT